MAMSRISRTVLGSNDKSGHPSLVLDVSGKASNLALLNMMLAVGMS